MLIGGGNSQSVFSAFSNISAGSMATMRRKRRVSTLPNPKKMYEEVRKLWDGVYQVTHWGRDKIDSISQTTFSSAFSWLKMFEFWLKLHRSLFLRVQLTIIQHWFRQWLGAIQVTSHYLNRWWLVYRHIYASLDLKEIKHLLKKCCC